MGLRKLLCCTQRPGAMNHVYGIDNTIKMSNTIKMEPAKEAVDPQESPVFTHN